MNMNHIQHHHHHSSLGGVNNIPPSFFPFSSRVSISPPNDSDEHANWCDSPPLTSSPIRGATSISVANNNNNYNSSVTALSEDNERLRRSNNMLMSELAHMKKLYNDIIYFVQNHVKPVTPSNSYNPSSLLLCNNTPQPTAPGNNVSMVQRPMNQLLGYYSNNPKQHPQLQTQTHHHQYHAMNSSPTNTNTSRSSITIVEGPSSNNNCKTKLFGVSLQSKKRVHPECGSNNNPINSETNKARLVLEKDDLGLNLMPPSTC